MSSTHPMPPLRRTASQRRASARRACRLSKRSPILLPTLAGRGLHGRWSEIWTAQRSRLLIDWPRRELDRRSKLFVGSRARASKWVAASTLIPSGDWPSCRKIRRVSSSTQRRSLLLLASRTSLRGLPLSASISISHATSRPLIADSMARIIDQLACSGADRSIQISI